MKNLLLILIILFINVQISSGQTVVLDTNGVTVKWTGTSTPSPYFVQASPRGTLEWFAIVNNSTKSYITDYAKNNQIGITYFTPPGNSAPVPFNNIVTSLVTNMTSLFQSASSFNQPIDNWDISNVTTLMRMFYFTSNFNLPIGNWNVSNVSNFDSMFGYATNFNQPIGEWNVSNANNMAFMFFYASNFNQPIGGWNVSNVSNFDSMFDNAYSFNQPIGDWDVGNATIMSYFFNGAYSFNQPLNSWNVSHVINMAAMFSNASSFNEPIGNWDVSNVTNMASMFENTTSFNQDIGSWNIRNVSNMFWMFNGVQLSTSNYDSMLNGWASISPNETPLKPNVTFSGGNSKYCNGSSSRSNIISTYGWTITDGGFDCSGLGSDEFEANRLKLYPNPVLNVLHIETDIKLINQSYTIADSIGRVVLNGKVHDGEFNINVEQLASGVYYLKVSDNYACKFIKK